MTRRADQSGAADDLVASVGAPDRFAAVFDRHFDAVHAYLARRAGRDVADELAGDVFLIAFERRSTFDATRGDARPWLFGIAGNVLRQRWRSGERRGRAVERLSGVVATTSTGAEVSERIDAQEAAVAVAAALDSLSDDDRETLLLLAWERLTYDEIADALGIPVGTVRSRISRARRRLRAALDRDDGTRSGPPNTTPEGLMT